MCVQCGRASVPPLASLWGAACGAVPAFCAGAVVGAVQGARCTGAGAGGGGGATTRVCALALLYVQCCEALSARGGGTLQPADLGTALFLGRLVVF